MDRTAGFWSEKFGGERFPEIDEWADIRSETLYAAKLIIDMSDDALARQAKAEEASLEWAHERRIYKAQQTLREGASRIETKRRALKSYLEGIEKGANRSVAGIKVAISLLAAGAGAGAFAAGSKLSAGVLAGRLGPFFRGALAASGTQATIGVVTEAAVQFAEMVEGKKDWGDFDWTKLAQIGMEQSVTGFVNAMIGGKLTQKLVGRLGVTSWAGQQVIGYLAGLPLSPLNTAVQVVVSRHVTGKAPVKSIDEFLDLVATNLKNDAIVGALLPTFDAAAGGYKPSGQAVGGGTKGGWVGGVSEPSPSGAPKSTTGTEGSAPAATGPSAPAGGAKAISGTEPTLPAPAGEVKAISGTEPTLPAPEGGGAPRLTPAEEAAIEILPVEAAKPIGPETQATGTPSSSGGGQARVDPRVSQAADSLSQAMDRGGPAEVKRAAAGMPVRLLEGVAAELFIQARQARTRAERNRVGAAAKAAWEALVARPLAGERKGSAPAATGPSAPAGGAKAISGTEPTLPAPAGEE